MLAIDRWRQKDTDTPMILLIVLFVILCCVAAFVPMPQALRVGVFIAAGVVLLVVVLNLLGLLDLPGGYVRPALR